MWRRLALDVGQVAFGIAQLGLNGTRRAIFNRHLKALSRSVDT